jgi:DNA invertase Pin-like site-specific DNA recombinase
LIPQRQQTKGNESQGKQHGWSGVQPGVFTSAAVSTAEQASSGLGLDAQRSAITAACQQRGWVLSGFQEDAGVSSVARRRPALESALAAVRSREANAIVVSKLDRLARSTLHAATLFADAAKNNWELVIVDVDASTAGGRFMRNVMAAAAEYEHELIAARTRDALSAARARGIQLGRPRDIEPDLEDRIVQLRRRHGLSARAIAKNLEAGHILSPRGSERWHPATITRVLHRHGVSFNRGRTRETKLKHQ